ncbi:MAG: hypothetical protein ABSG74_08195 [Candidatus Bathyarchaeia archaeon]|jgi:hypothetical protein
MTKIAFVNVGANASHGTLRSPIFEDDTFEFVPIPDVILSLFEHNRGLRYEELGASNGVAFREFIPAAYLVQFAHVDPDFTGFTYGDYPNHGRAANLRRLSPKDYVIFFSRLVRWDEGHFNGESGFYIIGFFEIETVFPDISRRPKKEVLREIEANPHVIRGECDSMFYDGFWIIKGTRRSKRFKKALSLDKRTIEKFGLRDRFGHRWDWQKFRSEDAAIGSYMRSIKVVEDGMQTEKILSIIGLS